MKTCNKCKTDKELSDFHKSPVSKDKHHASCKVCKREYDKQYALRNKAKRISQDKERYDNDPLGNIVAALGRNAVIRGAVKTEAYCIKSVVPFYKEARRLTKETGVPHEVDHIIPCSTGGLHCPTNLQVLTKSANAAKSNHISGEMTHD